jgi:RNA polymerase sigma-70 factor (ECF subfamily)
MAAPAFALDAVSLRGLLLAVSGIEPAASPTPAPAGGYLDALRRGDHDAWRRLFEDESPAIYRYAFSRLGRREDAEDVTNLVFAEAWRAIGRFRDEGLPLRAWLFGITRRVASRHRARFMTRNPQLSLDALQVEGSADAVSPEHMALAEALAKLETSQAEVLNLRFIHGLSLAEVASVLRTSVDGIKGRQKRGLESLRRQLDP